MDWFCYILFINKIKLIEDLVVLIILDRIDIFFLVIIFLYWIFYELFEISNCYIICVYIYIMFLCVFYENVNIFGVNL